MAVGKACPFGPESAPLTVVTPAATSEQCISKKQRRQGTEREDKGDYDYV
jgi:hypothetical protein